MIFLDLPHTRDTFDQFFMHKLNNATASIKLKSNIRENELEFLDGLGSAYQVRIRHCSENVLDIHRISRLGASPTE